jgi:hypothetical protein
MSRQMETLIMQAKGYLMMASILKQENVKSYKVYLRSAKVCMEKFKELKRLYDLDKTAEINTQDLDFIDFKMVA